VHTLYDLGRCQPCGRLTCCSTHTGIHEQSLDFESVHGSLSGVPEFDAARISLCTSNATGSPTRDQSKHVQSAPAHDDVWQAIGSDSSSDFSYGSSSGDDRVDAEERQTIRAARRALQAARHNARQVIQLQVVDLLTLP
jgi:hypothetical protein